MEFLCLHWVVSKVKGFNHSFVSNLKATLIFWRCNMDEEMQCELKDIQESIRRFCAVNKNDVIFISDFTAYDRKTGKVKDSILGIYGDKDVLVGALNHLRDITTLFAV